METSKAFPCQLSGFRSGRNIVDPALDLATYVEHERRNIAIAVFLDVRHALDTISHVHVLQALV